MLKYVVGLALALTVYGVVLWATASTRYWPILAGLTAISTLAGVAVVIVNLFALAVARFPTFMFGDDSRVEAATSATDAVAIGAPQEYPE